MNTDTTHKKARFIAGAVCPRCAAMDTIRVLEQNGEKYRECVDCGFSEKADFNAGSSQRELPTRVNKPRAPGNDIQVVRILEPEKNNKQKPS